MPLYTQETIIEPSTLFGKNKVLVLKGEKNVSVGALYKVSIPLSFCLSSLEKKSLLRDNVDLLVSLADVYFRAGDTKNATLKFEQAQMLDPYLIKGMFFY